MEEKIYEMNREISNLNANIHNDLEDLRQDHARNSEALSHDIKREITIRILEIDRGHSNQILKVNDEIDKLKVDTCVLNERMRIVNDAINQEDSKDEIDLRDTRMINEIRPNDRRTDTRRSSNSSVPMPISHFHALSSRVAAIENKLQSDLPILKEPVSSILKLEDLNLKDKSVRSDLAAEMQLRYLNLIGELKNLKSFIKEVETVENIDEFDIEK